MTRTAQPLVGRDHELHALERLLGDAREGASRFVIVTGEPGIGKTALLDELARRAAADGWLVLQGGATEPTRTGVWFAGPAESTRQTGQAAPPPRAAT